MNPPVADGIRAAIAAARQAIARNRHRDLPSKPDARERESSRALAVDEKKDAKK